MIQWYYRDGLFWFRVFGYGAVVKDLRKHPALFSERNGYRPGFRIGWLRVNWLWRGST